MSMMVKVRTVISITFVYIFLVSVVMDFYFIFSLLVLMTSGLFGVADGKWHDIQIKWMKDEVWLNIDYGQYEITQQSFNSVGGKVVTKVMVGDSSDKENYVQGCVRVSVTFSIH